MKKLMLTIALLLLGISVINAQRLIILHTNDTHSQIETIRVGRNKDMGGVERRLQFINSARRYYGKNKVLLLDAGDYSQGTPYFTVAKGDIEVELMNVMKYDVATLGNHEFDNGQEELSRRLKMANYTTLCCNYDFSDTPLRKQIKPYKIIYRGGLKIGIIGATLRLDNLVLASSLDGMKSLNIIKEVNKLAAMLKDNKHCDIIILLSHLGYSGGSLEHPSDVIMAQNSENIDIIIGGHSHTYLKEADYELNLKGKNVIITQSGAQGVLVGKLEVF
ncbi:MAG: metallophosphoesterase [Bacteroidales bacterium]|nr:metallophosphoesterase [Bacteroidales bacterium]